MADLRLVPLEDYQNPKVPSTLRLVPIEQPKYAFGDTLGAPAFDEQIPEQGPPVPPPAQAPMPPRRPVEFGGTPEREVQPQQEPPEEPKKPYRPVRAPSAATPSISATDIPGAPSLLAATHLGGDEKDVTQLQKYLNGIKQEEKNRPKTDYSKIYDETKSFSEAYRRDPLGFLQEAGQGIKESTIPMAGAAVSSLAGPAGAVIGGGASFGATSYANNLVAKTRELGGKLDDAKQFNETYLKNKAEIDEHAMKMAGVDTATGAIFGMIPGGGGLKGMVSRLTLAYPSIGVTGEATKRAIEGKPSMTGEEMAKQYAESLASGIPFELAGARSARGREPQQLIPPHFDYEGEVVPPAPQLPPPSGGPKPQEALPAPAAAAPSPGGPVEARGPVTPPAPAAQAPSTRAADLVKEGVSPLQAIEHVGQGADIVNPLDLKKPTVSEADVTNRLKDAVGGEAADRANQLVDAGVPAKQAQDQTKLEILSKYSDPQQVTALGNSVGLAAAQDAVNKSLPAKVAEPVASPTISVAPFNAPVVAEPKVAFTTALGSKYVMDANGSTIRDKAPRPEHPGDEGVKPPSDKTVFVDKNSVQAIAPPQGATWRIVDNNNGTLLVAVQNPDGSWGVSPSQRNVPYSTAPEVGKYPIELWGAEPGNNNIVGYSKIHPGNAIVSIAQPQPQTQPQESKAGKVDYTAGKEEPKLDVVEGHKYISMPAPRFMAAVQTTSNLFNDNQKNDQKELPDNAPIKVRLDPSKLQNGGIGDVGIAKAKNAIQQIIVGPNAFRPEKGNGEQKKNAVEANRQLQEALDDLSENHGVNITYVGQDKKPRALAGAGDTIISYARAMRGIKDKGGELRAMDLHKVPGVVSEYGVPFDTFADHLILETDHYPGFKAAVNASESNKPTPAMYQRVMDDLGARKSFKEPTTKRIDPAETDYYAEIQKEKDAARQKVVEMAKQYDLPPDEYIIDDAVELMRGDSSLSPYAAYIEAHAREAKRIAISDDIWPDILLGDPLAFYPNFMKGYRNEAPRPPQETRPTSGAVGPEGTKPANAPAPEGKRPTEPPVSQASVSTVKPAEVKAEPKAEPGAEGKPQLVIPGADKITEGQLAQRLANKPMQAKVDQKEPDGLFGSGRNQLDLLSMPKEPQALVVQAKRPSISVPAPFDLAVKGQLTSERAQQISDMVKQHNKDVENAILGYRADVWRDANRKAESASNRGDDAKAKEYYKIAQNIESSLPKKDVDALYGVGEKGSLDPATWRNLSDRLAEVEGGRQEAVEQARKEIAGITDTPIEKMGETDRGRLAVIQHALLQEEKRGGDIKTFLAEAVKDYADYLKRSGIEPNDINFMVKNRIDSLKKILNIPEKDLVAKIEPPKPATKDFGPFKAGVKFSKSKNFPDDLAGVAEGWAKMLGIDAPIHMMTFDDAKAANFRDRGSLISKYGRNSKAYGASLYFGGAGGQYFTILIRETGNRVKDIETVAHELGHVLQNYAFESADPAVKKKLEDAHRDWKKGFKDKTVGDVLRSRKAPQTAKMMTENGLADLTPIKDLRPVDKEYTLSFREYFADQVARWAMTSEKPLGVVEKFFKGVGAGLRKLYHGAKREGAFPNETFKDFIESVTGNVEVKQAEGGGGNNEGAFFERDILNPDEEPKLPEPKVEIHRNGVLAQGLVDKFSDLYKIQKAYEKLRGAQLPESMDAYLAQELFNNRVIARQDAAWKDEVQPLLAELKKLKISTKDFDDFLTARHAPERNERMGARDPKRFGVDGGSGMDNAEARHVLNKFREPVIVTVNGQRKTLPTTYDIMDRLDRDFVRPIIRKNLTQGLRDGLLTQEQFDGYTRPRTEGGYNHYVPLWGSAEAEAGADPNIHRSTRNFGVSGKEFKTAFGRESRSFNTLFNVIQQRMEGIVRQEKNKVDTAIANFVAAHPDNKMARLITNANAPTIKYLAADGTVHERVAFTPQAMETILPFKVNGEQKYLQFDKDNPATVRLVNALKGMPANAVTPVMNGIFQFSRTFSRLNTSLVPDFFLTNFPRDVQDALMTMYGTKEGMAGQFMQDLSGAAKTIFQIETGMPTTEADRILHQEWVDSGGKLNYGGFRDIAMVEKEIEKSLRGAFDSDVGLKDRALRAGDKALDTTVAALSKVNDIFEDAVRFAVYRAARKNGYSKERAASLSLNSTVNFQTKGAWMPTLNALKPFLSASVGSMRAVYRLAQNSPKRFGQFLSAILMGSVANSLLGVWMSDKDDIDPTKSKYYTNVRGYERQKNFILPYQFADGHYGKIPTGFFYGPIAVLGDNIAGVLTGNVKPQEAATNVAMSIYDYANPLGSGTWASQLLFTPFAPFVQHGYNKDWLGRPIHPEETNRTKGLPASEQYKMGTPEWAISTSRFLNSATDGSQFKKGWLDVYPDTLNHYFTFFTGGLGTFTGRSVNAVNNYFENTPTPKEEIPYMRRLMTNTKGIDESKFYDIKNKIQEKENTFRSAVDQYQTDKSPTAKATIIELGKELNMGIKDGKAVSTNSVPAAFKKIQDQNSELKEAIEMTRANPKLSPLEKDSRVKRYEGMITSNMLSARKFMQKREPSELTPLQQWFNNPRF